MDNVCSVASVLNKEEERVCGVIIDLRAAFDRVDRNKL